VTDSVFLYLVFLFDLRFCITHVFPGGFLLFDFCASDASRDFTTAFHSLPYLAFASGRFRALHISAFQCFLFAIRHSHFYFSVFGVGVNRIIEDYI
jgi:hypothetical protein